MWLAHRVTDSLVPTALRKKIHGIDDPYNALLVGHISAIYQLTTKFDFSKLPVNYYQIRVITQISSSIVAGV